MGAAQKHKGQIEMYLVDGLLPELQRPDNPRAPNSEFEARYAALQMTEAGHS